MDVGFGFSDGFIQRQALCQKGGYSRREGATGSVRVFRGDAREGQFYDFICFGIVEDIHQLFVGKMTGFQQYGNGPLVRQLPGNIGEVGLPQNFAA